MAFPFDINGNTYTQADFAGLGYLTGFPAVAEDISVVASQVVADAAAQQITAFVTSGGSAAAYTITPTPAFAGPYAAGNTFRFKAHADCSGSPTLDVSGVGAVELRHKGDPLNALDIRAGDVVTVTYDGTYFQIETPNTVYQSSFLSGAVKRTMQARMSDTIHMADVDVRFDASRDETSRINDLLAELEAAGGGKVYAQRGTVLVGAGGTPIILPNKCWIVGEGRHATRLKLGNGSDCPVIRTDDFATLTGSGIWKTALGMKYGMGLQGLLIDGNRANQTVAAPAVQFYAKGYNIEDILIIEAKGDAFYTEGPNAGGQDDYTDMPETEISIKIKGAGGHGINCLGPHDAHWREIYVASVTGDGAVFNNTGATDATSDIDFAHIYDCDRGFVSFGARIKAGTIIAETTKREAYSSTAIYAQIANLEVYQTSSTITTGAAVYVDGDFQQFGNIHIRANTYICDGLVLDGYGNQVGTLFVVMNATATNANKAVWLKPNANANSINSMYLKGNGSGAIGLCLDSGANNIRGQIENFLGTGGQGLQTNPTASRGGNNLDLSLNNCKTLWNSVTVGEKNNYRINGWADTGQTKFTGITRGASEHWELGLSGNAQTLLAYEEIESGTFAIDSTGVKTITVNHNLYTTPPKKSVDVTVIENVTADDWAYDWIKVTNTTSTQIEVKIKVGTASATGSATAKLGIKARA